MAGPLGRRELIGQIGAVGGAVVLAGCGAFTPNGAHLVIENNQEATLEVKITLTAVETGDVVYEKAFELPGEQEIETDEIVGGGEYTVRAVVNGNWSVSRELAASCSSTAFYVTIREADSSVIGQSYCG